MEPLLIARNISKHYGGVQFRPGAFVSHAAMTRFAQPFLREVGLDATGSEACGSLSIARQQLVSIARALSMGRASC